MTGRYTTRQTLILAALASILTLCAGCAPDQPQGADVSVTGTPEVAAPAERILTQLPGYPEETVPLYEVKLLDTVYYSVRNDPQWAAVEGGLRNYYHSVWESNVPASEVHAYYLDLCDEVDEEYTTAEQLSGRVGAYEISLNTGFHNDKNMAYLSVDLPRSDVSDSNRFFDEYPESLVELSASFAVFEEMYYETLVSSTDRRFERHFDVVDADGDGQVDLQQDARLSYFEERYGDREGFELQPEYETATWKDGVYTVTVAFMDGYDRGALTIGFDEQP